MLFAGLLLAGVAAASVAIAQTDPAQPSPAPAPAAQAPAAPQTAAAPAVDEPVITPEDAYAGKIGKPPAGKALIVFYRPSGPGMALGFTIKEGEKPISKIGNGSYQVFIADPGTHEYKIQSEATDTLRLEIDDGETYFVRETIGMGLFVGRPHLALADKAAFDKIHASLRVSKWTPPVEKAADKTAQK
jgi:hypothetical protein